MMKLIVLMSMALLFAGCANYQNWANWKDDKADHRYTPVVECNISNDSYAGKAKLWAGPNKDKVVGFYLKPYYKLTMPYTKETILLVEDK